MARAWLEERDWEDPGGERGSNACKDALSSSPPCRDSSTPASSCSPDRDHPVTTACCEDLEGGEPGGECGCSSSTLTVPVPLSIPVTGPTPSPFNGVDARIVGSSASNKSPNEENLGSSSPSPFSPSCPAGSCPCSTLLDLEGPAVAPAPEASFSVSVGNSVLNEFGNDDDEVRGGSEENGGREDPAEEENPEGEMTRSVGCVRRGVVAISIDFSPLSEGDGEGEGSGGGGGGSCSSWGGGSGEGDLGEGSGGRENDTGSCLIGRMTWIGAETRLASTPISEVWTLSV